MFAQVSMIFRRRRQGLRQGSFTLRGKRRYAGAQLRIRTAGGHTVAKTPADTTGPAAAETAPERRPIRVTVELEFDEHRELRRLCDRYADEIGVAQVAGAEVFRALLQLAQEDDTVARKLGRSLARSGGRRHRT
jgi:hypothetical protein